MVFVPDFVLCEMLFSPGDNPTREANAFRKGLEAEIPPTAQLVSVREDFQRAGFFLVFVDASFEETPLGSLAECVFIHWEALLRAEDPAQTKLDLD